MSTRRKSGFDVIEGGQASVGSDPFGLADYLQMAGLGKHSVVVSVQGARSSGEIVVRSGEAWSARDEEGEGEEAFRRLLDATLTQQLPVTCRPIVAGAVPRNIRCSLESMMLEAARRWDESTRDLPSVGALDASSRATEHFEAFFDEGIDALLRKDYPEALRAFSTAHQIRPDDSMVRANLERLAALGVMGEEAP